MPNDPARDQLLNLLRRCADQARSLPPKGILEMKPVDGSVASLFWRAVRLLDGIVALLEKDLPEEALILARSLFIDALRLAEINDAGRGRPALVLGWVNSSIKEKKNLMKEASRLGLEANPQRHMDELSRHLQQLDGYRKRHGVGRLRKFLSERAAAVKFGRAQEYWDYLFAHEIVHGSDAAFTFSRTKIAANTVGVSDRTTDPQFVRAVGCFAAKSLLQAAMATANVFEWQGGHSLELLSIEVNNLASNHASGG